MEEITPELRTIFTELISGQLTNEHQLLVFIGLLFGVTVASAHLVATSVLAKNRRMVRRMNSRGRRRVRTAVHDHIEERNFSR